MEERRILIVANQTAPGDHLKEAVRERMSGGECKFMLVVPVTPPHGGLTYTQSEADALATKRMEEALEGLRDLGADIEGHIEEGSPMDAIAAAMQVERFEHHRPFDVIILSTLPPGVSRWIKQDLPPRLERRYAIPVTHIIGEAHPAQVG
jgi:hypothetical protein